MKSNLRFKLIPALIVALALSITSVSGQGSASKTPETKHFLIEKGTGVACGGCPAIDSTCNAVVLSHPKEGIMIEYHVGPDARPQTGLADYTTTYGTFYYDLLPFTYNMMVNRRDQGVPYGYTYIYNQVQAGADLAITETAPVNVAMAATYDVPSRTVTMDVEAYYTSDANTAKNFLNIAVTEDSLVSKQYVVSKWVNNYVHNHVFRTNVNGQWGDTISNTKKGRLVQRTYKYTVPAGYDPKHCHLILYVAEDSSAVKPQKKAGNIINCMQMNLMGGLVGIDKPQTSDLNVQIYPNPSNGVLNIDMNEAYMFDIMDISGKKVYSGMYMGSGQNKVNLSGLNNGFYLVKITSAKGSVTKKILLSN